MRRRLVMLVAGLLVLVGVAEASSPGLYFEASATADGVYVRRMRDTSNGVTCYIARGRNAYDSVADAVGISCVKVGP